MLVDRKPFEGVCLELRAPLERRGFTELTTVQQAVLAPEVTGRNLRISSQTGSGKTVALGMALAADLIAHARAVGRRRAGPLALVITPTRELALQVCAELGWLYEDVPELTLAAATGGTSVPGEKRQLARKPAVVVGTPGRLLDHQRSGALDCSGVRHVVLDEADKMLEMGFREELEAILAGLPDARQSHLVSATLPIEVRRLADRFQHDAVHLAGTQLGVPHSDIEHVAQLVRLDQQYAALVNLLLLAQGERSLIFVQKRTDAAELAELLAGDGFSALPLSGDLAQAQRTRTLSAFRTGIVKTLVATDVAARGIDVADISTVIHVDMPSDASIYTHRSGRTGRAGRQGRSLLLVPVPAERRVRAVLAQCKVKAAWGPALTPRAAQRTLKKRFHGQLHALLGAETTPDAARTQYARELLDRHDPALLVATLLQLAEPQLPREPMEVSVVEPRPERPSDAARRPGPERRPTRAPRAGGPASTRPGRPGHAKPAGRAGTGQQGRRPKARPAK